MSMNKYLIKEEEEEDEEELNKLIDFVTLMNTR